MDLGSVMFVMFNKSINFKRKTNGENFYFDKLEFSNLVAN